MSQPTDPVPQRIGDAERDRATEYLREHLAQGRLDQAEFDDRLTAALTARTSADLDPLFSDLPAPKPGADVARSHAAPSPPAPSSGSTVPTPPPSSDGFRFALAILSAVLWPAVLIAWLGFDIGGWWLIFLPIAVSSAAARFGLEDQRRRNRHDRRRQRRLDRGRD